MQYGRTDFQILTSFWGLHGIWHVYLSRQSRGCVSQFTNIPTGALALQFSMREPRVTSTILGITRPERVQQTIDWANWPISDDVWAEIDALPASRDDPEANRDYKSG